MTRSGKTGPASPAAQGRGGKRAAGAGGSRQPQACREVFGRFVSTLSRLESGKPAPQPRKDGNR